MHSARRRTQSGERIHMQYMMSRRSALQLLVPAAGAAILAACSGPTPSPSAQSTASAPDKSSGGPSTGSGGTPSSSAAKPAGAPKPGGTLRIGLASEPANIDGHIRTP